MPFRDKDEQTIETESREEEYKKMFAKIGRDFVSIEDLVDLIENINQKLPGLNLQISTVKAVSKATEYKQQLDGEIEQKVYNDLIKIDDDSDEEKLK